MPTETTPKPPAPIAAIDTDGNMIDTAAPVSDQQREKDFRKRFVWREKELVFSVASETYYRDLRAHMNAPELNAYRTIGDLTGEAPRILYCCSLTAREIRALQLLPAEKQIEVFSAWVGQNIEFHELIAAATLADEIRSAIARARTQPGETNDAGIDGMGN